MKNSLRLLLTVLLIAVAVPASAERQKKIAVIPADASEIQNKLPVVSRCCDRVMIAFDMVVPAKMLKSRQGCVAVPVFVNGDYRLELPPVAVKGRNYRVITDGREQFDGYEYPDYLIDADYLKEGMTISYRYSMPYSEELKGAVLFLEQTVYCACGDVKWETVSELDAHGIFDYTEFFSTDGMVAYYIKSYINKSENYKFSSNSVFKLNSTVLLENELKKSGYDELHNLMDEIVDVNGRISSLDVFTASSPDGPEAHNAKLAEARSKSIKDFMDKDLYSLNIPDSIVHYSWSAENWEPFIEQIPSFSNADRIRKIVDENSVLDVRESKLRQLSNYGEINKMWQGLRNCQSELKYSIYDGKYSDDIIFNSNEYSYIVLGDDVQNVASDMDRILEEYNKAPNSKNANNVMVAYMDEGNYDKALIYAEKISNKNLDPVISNNKGVLYAVNGDFYKAAEYFNRAEGAPMADYNRGVSLLYLGKYKEAAELLKPYYGTVPAAACLSDGMVDEGITSAVMSDYPDAECNYITALGYAREGKAKPAFEYLKRAVSQESSYKAAALNQAEFIKYRDVEEFKMIIDAQ